MSRRTLSHMDTISALATGLLTGVIAWRILDFLGKGLPVVPNASLVIIVPVLWLSGIQLGYILSSWYKPFAQFGRFVAIGFTNAAVDFGVLYLFIGITGLATGSHYATFKAISFAIATVHSYFWNKYWAFDSAASGGGTREVLRFLAVSVTSLVLNVVGASIAVAAGPFGGLTPAAWAGVGAIVGSAAALFFSFVGFRLFVFAKK